MLGRRFPFSRYEIVATAHPAASASAPMVRLFSSRSFFNVETSLSSESMRGVARSIFNLSLMNVNHSLSTGVPKLNCDLGFVTNVSLHDTTMSTKLQGKNIVISTIIE